VPVVVEFGNSHLAVIVSEVAVRKRTTTQSNDPARVNAKPRRFREFSPDHSSAVVILWKTCRALIAAALALATAEMPAS